MNSVYEYSDFRLFLRDYLAARKAQGNPLTYEELGKKVGFQSKGFVTQILQGKSKVPVKLIGSFSKAFDLKKKEREYFSLLVNFNQAKTHKKKNEFFQELTGRFRRKIKNLDPDKFEYHQKWYFSAVRSLLGYYPFRGDHQDLARQLNPPITPGQAKKAVQLLLKLSMIEKREDGCYHLTHRVISGGRQVESVAITNFQRETMDLARESLERFPKDQRSSSTLTLALSPQGYAEAVKKIDALRKELMEVARYDRKVNRVVQFNLHAFPLTQVKKEGKS